MKILIVEDNPSHREKIISQLENHFEIAVATNRDEALAKVAESGWDCLLLDTMLPDHRDQRNARFAAKAVIEGLEAAVHECGYPAPVIVLMSSASDLENHEETIESWRKDGTISRFLAKTHMPVFLDELWRHLTELRAQQLLDPVKLSQFLEQQCGLIARSPAMQEVARNVREYAPFDIPILLLGETGVGKDRVARAIHKMSRRSSHSFVDVVVPSIGEQVQKSELFGHKKGAFTDASEDRVGKIEAAHRGTIFLNEIGDATAAAQTDLLHVLDAKEVTRVGENTPRRVDVRFVYATNKDLTAEVAAKAFREDLYYRINVGPITVPPLRERIDDIAPLVSDLMPGVVEESAATAPTSIHPDLLALFRSYQWPGNVRQLRNVLMRLVLRAHGAELTPTHLQPGDDLWEASQKLKHRRISTGVTAIDLVDRINNSLQGDLDHVEHADVVDVPRETLSKAVCIAAETKQVNAAIVNRWIAGLAELGDGQGFKPQHAYIFLIAHCLVKVVSREQLGDLCNVGEALVRKVHKWLVALLEPDFLITKVKWGWSLTPATDHGVEPQLIR